MPWSGKQLIERIILLTGLDLVQNQENTLKSPIAMLQKSHFLSRP